MKENAQELWLQTAQNFQQTMTESLTKAFESLQNMDMGAASAKLMAPTAKAPKIKFSPEKMQALQQAYLQEASDLWTNTV